MSNSFSFIHAADLHIASPFVGLTAQDSAMAQRLRASTFEAYDALIELCVEREVDFLVVAGDVYDGRDRSLRAQLAFRDGLARLGEAGIRAFVVHGNHDPLDGRTTSISWPDQIHVFGDRVETCSVELDGAPVATVTGVSYPTSKVVDNLAADFPRPAGDLFHIGLLHCNVGSNTGHEGYAPCELGELTGAGFDYWALGHVHTRQVLAESPWVVYPGNPQGRSFRECGARGCFVVEVGEDGCAELEFVALDTVRWTQCRLSISDHATMDALEESIFGQIAAEADSARLTVSRVVLDGRGQLFGDLSAPGHLDDLLDHLRERLAGHDPQVWLQRIRLECRPDVDLVERAGAGDLVAEVLNLADEYLAESADLGALLSGPLADLYGNPRTANVLEPPDEEVLRRFVQSAKLLCFDLLDG